MSLVDNNGGVGYSIPVQPMGNYGGGLGNSIGGDDAWLLLFIILLMNGGMWGGFGGFGGFGGAAYGMGIDYLYPWMNNSQNINNGFRDQMINGNIQGIQNSVISGFGDTALGIAGINQNICQTGNSVVGAVTGAQNAITQQMYTNQIADLERSFAAQTAQTQGMNTIASNLQNCCCENRANIADLKYTVATENCADRAASYQNTRDIIDNQNRNGQAILDKLCQLELDGVKGELSAANNTINQLRTQLLVSNNEASQVAQTAQILAGQTAEVDALYNRLNSCPVPTTPVYGRTPIFNCNQNQGCGCGCGNNGLI